MTISIKTPVAIIGGGLSGLYTAYLLQQHGIEFTVFEARDRLGGRILSMPPSKTEQGVALEVERYDLGPSWFWPDMQPRMDKLVKDLKLTSFPQHQTGAHLFDQGRGTAPQRHEIGRTSSPLSMRLSGGMQVLIEALTLQLPVDTIKLNHQATKIEFEASGSVTLGMNGYMTTVKAQHVVLALPPRLFSNTIQFTPSLPESLFNHCQNTMTWMAAHAKFVAVYNKPFWRHQGLSGSVSSQTGPLVEVHDASSLHGKPALFGFVGINAAARKAAGSKALTQVILNQLSDLFGEQAAKPVNTFLTDWSEEAFTSTEQDQATSNSHPTYGLPASADDLWNGHLLFAGTESARIAGGYLEGALEAAELATKKLTSNLT